MIISLWTNQKNLNSKIHTQHTQYNLLCKMEIDKSKYKEFVESLLIIDKEDPDLLIIIAHVNNIKYYGEIAYDKYYMRDIEKLLKYYKINPYDNLINMRLNTTTLCITLYATPKVDTYCCSTDTISFELESYDIYLANKMTDMAKQIVQLQAEITDLKSKSSS